MDFFCFPAVVKTEGRQKENKACWCEGKSVSQLGHIFSQAGQDNLCWKIEITQARSAGHSQHMLLPLFKIILDYLLNRDHRSSEWHTQRHRYSPAARMERGITCLTSQLRNKPTIPFQGKYSEGEKQSYCWDRPQLCGCVNGHTRHNSRTSR